MHKQLGIDMQVKGIPTGKHQRSPQGPHTAVCLSSEGLESCHHFLCPRASQSQGPRAYPPHASRQPLTSPSGFCKVFPADSGDGLCWHVAKSAQNIMICWPQLGQGFVFVWPYFFFFFPPNQGHGKWGIGKREMKVKILIE